MITGSCLCGGVRFELERAAGPFELCHCRRCRKVSGAAFAAMIGVRTADFRLLQGQELIAAYDAPILERPPAYRTSFCRRCGSPVPNPDPKAEWFEVPAGTLDDDPQLRPDKHIFVELKAPWFEITDALPRHDKPALYQLRQQMAQTASVPHNTEVAMLKLDHLAICVSDPQRSRDWYTSYFGFTVEFEVPERDTVALQDDAGLTMFLVKDAERARHPSCGLTFQVADVETKYRELVAAGLQFVKAPQKLYWGYGAELADPDGYLIHLWDEHTMREQSGG